MAKKDPFKDLDEEFKDEFNSADEDAIRRKISDIALAQVALMEAKEADEDLQACRAAASEAGAVYREGTKRHKLQTLWLKQILSDRGKE